MSDPTAREESILRTILKNEITWLIVLVSAIMAFVYNVIIPLNTMQLTLVQMQTDISGLKGFDTRITVNSNDIIKLQEQMTQLQGKPTSK
jgi:hypothetical protein